MKKNKLALALMLMLASTTVFADGEVGHGTRSSENPPPAVSQTNQSTSLLDQVLNAIYALVA